MQIGLNLFANFLVPLIAIIAWLSCLIRLRSIVLTLITTGLLAFIVISSANPLLVTTRNPYFMLLLSALLMFDIAVLSRIDKSDKSYLITANTIVLMMLIALHAWTLYLRQSDLYFYEQSSMATTLYSAFISLMSLSLPVIAYFSRKSH